MGSVATFRRSTTTSPHLTKGVLARFQSDAGGDHRDSDAVYLHVGPSGDCWAGYSIFAAKHLQPDYVKSVKLLPGMCVETLLEVLGEKDDWTKKICDDEKLPDDLMEYLKETELEQRKND